MSNVVNLNKFRKERKRQKREAAADANRAKFGRTKQERAHLTLESQRRRAELDNKLLADKSDPDDTPENREP